MASRARRVGRLMSAIFLLALLPMLLQPGASASIGAGSTLKVETQIQMLFKEGGGYATWELSGPVVKQVRSNIDADGNGNISTNEGTDYTGLLDRYLENNVRYGSAVIARSALLTKDIIKDTEGLLTSVNSSSRIVIRFYFNANLRPAAATVNLGDTTIPLAPIRALRGEENQSFAGRLEWDHVEVVVGLASFSSADVVKGSLQRLRGPGVEVLWYGVSLGGNETALDRIRFEPFSALQCPLELFLVLVIFGVATVYLPRHYLRAGRARKVRWLHVLAWLLVLANLLLFLLGVDGLAVWAASPVLMLGSWFLSWQIYIKKWRGIAKPVLLLPPPGTAAATAAAGEGAGLPPYQGAAESPPPRGPPAPPPGPSAPPAPETVPPVQAYPAGPVPPALPAPAPAKRRTLRCPKCRATFDIDDSGVRPLAIRCTSCGAGGVLSK